MRFTEASFCQVNACYLPSHCARSLHPLYPILLRLFITTSSRWVMSDGCSKTNGFPRRAHQNRSEAVATKHCLNQYLHKIKQYMNLLHPYFFCSIHSRWFFCSPIDKVVFPLPDTLLNKGNCLWYMFSKQSLLDSQIAYSQSVLRLFGTRTWRPEGFFFSYRHRDLPLNFYAWGIGTK